MSSAVVEIAVYYFQFYFKTKEFVFVVLMDMQQC